VRVGRERGYGGGGWVYGRDWEGVVGVPGEYCMVGVLALCVLLACIFVCFHVYISRAACVHECICFFELFARSGSRQGVHTDRSEAE